MNAAASETVAWYAKPDVWTAIGTWGFLVGAALTTIQLRRDRTNIVLDRTTDILEQWNDDDIQALFYHIDYADNVGVCRLRAERLYRMARPNRRKQLMDWLAKITELAQKTDILLSRNLIDGNFIAEQYGRDILLSYYSLENILVQLAAEDRFNFKGFWRFANRLQTYYRQLPDDETDYNLCNHMFAEPRLRR